MFSTNVPKYLWGEAILIASCLINRMPTRVLNYIPPLECFQKYFLESRIQSNLPLKIFGCTIYVHIPSKDSSKLDPRAEKYIFIGYAPNKKGYKCFNPKTRKNVISMEVTFLEKQPFFQKISLQGENIGEEGIFWDVISNPLPKTIDCITNPISQNEFLNKIKIVIPNIACEIGDPKTIFPNTSESSTGVEIPIVSKKQDTELLTYSRKNHKKGERSTIPLAQAQLDTRSDESKRNTSTIYTSVQNFVPIPNEISELAIDPLPNSMTNDNSNNLDIPIDIRKGKRSCTSHLISKYLSYGKLSKKYNAFTSKISNLHVPRNIQENDPDSKSTVMEKMNDLRKNGTWEVVDLPIDQKTVGCKWLFIVKCKADDSVERFKAKLVAKGFTQTYGVDYQKTFAPITKINYIRVLLSLAANYNWPIHQLDIKNAFLNGDLEEEVFMSPPPGFEKVFSQHKVCKLKKSLHGLKKSLRAWFERFRKAMKCYGYHQSQANHIMFYKHSEKVRYPY